MESAKQSDSAEHPVVPNATIDTLPDETLIAIFEHIRNMSITWTTSVPFAVVASHVSGRWRSIAIGTTSFWTNIFSVPELTQPCCCVFREVLPATN
jgi:hypothetical protein